MSFVCHGDDRDNHKQRFFVSIKEYDFCSSWQAVFALPRTLADSDTSKHLKSISESLVELAASGLASVNPYP